MLNRRFFCLTLPELIPIECTIARKELIDQQKEQGMGIRKLSEDVMLVDLPSDGPRRAEELKAVNEVVSNKSDSNMIMDFSGVEIINSWNISNLLILQNLLAKSGHQLILCDVGTVTKCIFVVAGLSDIFTFADDRFAAQEAIGNTNSSTNTRSQ